MLKILLIIIGVIGGIGVLFFLSIFLRMAFIGKISEYKLIFAMAREPLSEGIIISEISRNERPWPNQNSYRNLDTGDVQPAVEMVLLNDGRLSSERRVFDKDPGKEVQVIKDTNQKPQYIFTNNQVYHAKEGNCGKLFGSFSNPELSIVRHVSHLNHRYFLMIGDPTTYKYAYSYIWQVDKNNLEKHKIAEDPYFTFVRPPMIFRPEGFGGLVLVYYIGSVNYGFGGDSSRPEFSYIRIYNDKFEQGLDIAKFGFKAGTIVNVEWENNALIATGDPSRPAAAYQEPRPARVWRIEIPMR
jgi:hypothetical protein